LALDVQTTRELGAGRTSGHSSRRRVHGRRPNVPMQPGLDDARLHISGDRGRAASAQGALTPSLDAAAEEVRDSSAYLRECVDWIISQGNQCAEHCDGLDYIATQFCCGSPPHE
jgi:hypothetical protein